MNKRLATLSLVSVMALASLASCGEGYNYKDGIMLYLNGTAYTTNELFKSYGLDSAAGVKAYYDVINNVSIETDIPTTGLMTNTVNSEIESFKTSAETNAKTNGTTQSEELEKLLTAKGFDTLEELEDSYYLAQKTTKASDNYYSTDNYTNTFIPEYVKNCAPYHVRHILVKVDAASGSLYNGTISESDADDITNVAERLSEGETFGSVALTKSEDTLSAAVFGDAGIMSTKTSFVSEFKYGLYTYDALFNPDTTAAEKQSVISTTFSSDADNVSSYTSEINDKAYGIPYSAIKELDYYADKTTDANGQTVINSTDSNYPRNILFNNYFNNHSISFVYLDTPTSATSAYYTQADYDKVDQTRYKTVSGVSDHLKQFAAGTNYSTVSADLPSAPVLCDETGRPIIVTRAGSGSGTSGYQGIHFIIAQEDPFTTTTENLEKYYTLEAPSTSTSSSTLGTTYVGFINTTDTSTYNTRISNVKTAVKAMDTNFEYRQFEHYRDMAETNGLSISPDINTAVKQYIASQRATTAESETRTYNTSWETYLQLLKTYDEFSSRIIPVDAGISAFNSNTVEAFNNTRAGK